MKKLSVYFLCFILILSLSGCFSNSSQSETQKNIGESIDLSDENIKTSDNSESSEYVKSLESKIDDLETQLETIQSNYSTLENDYLNYKEKMKPYEELEAAEAEARQIEADRILQEEAEAEQARLEEEERLKAEKEAKGYETGITYEQLARNPDEYIGEKIKFKGEAIQVIEDQSSNEIQIRLAVNGDYDRILLIGYDQSIVSQRVLEDDNITVYGLSIGTITYQSTMGVV